MKIVFNNGNTLDNLELNGNTYQTSEVINPSVYAGATVLKIYDGELLLEEHSVSGCHSFRLGDVSFFTFCDIDELTTLSEAVSELAEIIGGLM